MVDHRLINSQDIIEAALSLGEGPEDVGLDPDAVDEALDNIFIESTTDDAHNPDATELDRDTFKMAIGIGIMVERNRISASN